jgi:uncharacterized Fe-S cluster-containing radical SAM superfamily protein
MNTHGLARQLIWLWLRYIEVSGGTRITPTARAARAKFDGATEAAHAVGFGLTAAHVSAIVRNTLPHNPKTWLQPEVIEDVADRLTKQNYADSSHVESSLSNAPIENDWR